MAASPASVKPTTRRRPSPRIAQWARTWYFLRRNTLALIGLGIMLFFVFVALYSFVYPAPNDELQLYCGTYGGQPGALCPTICTYAQGTPIPHPGCYPVDPVSPSVIAPTVDLTRLSGGPLPLGSLTTSPNGPYFYSIMDGLVKGAPWSLGISAGIVATGAIIGLFLGSIAGFKGGLVDEAIMRFTDIFLAIPALLLVLVLLAVLGSTEHTLEGRVGVLMVAFIIVWWPFYTRIVRGQVLVTREQKYVEASRASGAKTGRLVFRHIIPNSLYPVFVQMSLDVGSIPLLLGAVVFLGFHVFPNTQFTEWGSISALSISQINGLITLCTTASPGVTCTFPWWQIFFPGLVVFLFAISVNFLSDGLRDALDPRLRR